MGQLDDLLNQNTAWAASVLKDDPEFFERLSAGQSPRYFWIGCSDSRVPATQITDLDPGEIFVHRNVANVVVHSDLNLLSALQFAVDVLKVRNVIVCGHFNCGGVAAAFSGARYGLVDNWLNHVRDVAVANEARLALFEDPAMRLRLLEKLNVIAQVFDVARTTIVRDAWSRAQPLSIHGWIYGVRDGLIRDQELEVNQFEGLNDLQQAAYDGAVERVRRSFSPARP